MSAPPTWTVVQVICMVPLAGVILLVRRKEQLILDRLEQQHGKKRQELSRVWHTHVNQRKLRRYMKDDGAKDPILESLVISFERWQVIAYALMFLSVVAIYIAVWFSL